MKRGLVVSVGGSRGAYAGGIVEYKIRSGIVYDATYGSSTGSLIVPFAATGNFNQLKLAFTDITMDDIFTLNPFKIEKSKNGVYRYTINHWNVFKNIFIKGQSSLGDTTRLKTHTIPKFFTEETYLNIINNNKNVTIIVTNISTGELEEKSVKDCTHDQFIDWMWASTCAPPFMSIPELNECHYTDGGVVSQVPIRQAILDGCDEIDIIILDKEENDWPIEHIRNLFHFQIKLLLMMMNKIQFHQTDLGYLATIAKKKIRLNFHYTKRRLTNNSLIFDKKLMNKWWDEGYEYAENHEYSSFLLDGRNNTYESID